MFTIFLRIRVAFLTLVSVSSVYEVDGGVEDDDSQTNMLLFATCSLRRFRAEHISVAMFAFAAFFPPVVH